MSLLLESHNHQSNTSGLKTTQYEYVYDTVNTCHLLVRCDATLNGPVNVTGDVTVNGDLDVTGTITGTVVMNADYRVSYNTVSFVIPSTLATTYEVYQVNTTAAPLTVTLPTISALDGLKKRSLFIVDVGGALSVHPLTLVTTGGDTVGGDTSMEVSVDYTGVHLLSNANVAPVGAGMWLVT